MKVRVIRRKFKEGRCPLCLGVEDAKRKEALQNIEK
jgi:hypothetical protein